MTIIAMTNRLGVELHDFSDTVRKKAKEAREWTSEKVEKVSTVIQDSELWKTSCQPNYNRYIASIKETEKNILKAGCGTALIIMTLALTVFNHAFVPICAMAATLAISGSYSIAAKRINQRFDKEAAQNELIPMRDEASKIKIDLDVVNQHYNKLHTDKKYNHRDKDIENLRQQINTFQKGILSQDDPVVNSARQTFVTYLSELIAQFQH